MANEKEPGCRQKRWTIVLVDRPFEKDAEFLTENEMWQLLQRSLRQGIGSQIAVEKVGPSK